MKNNTGKQLNKNKKLLTEFVAGTPMVEDEGHSEEMLDAMDLAPTLGFTFGDDKKKLFLSLFSVIEAYRDRDSGVFVSNTKGKREL